MTAARALTVDDAIASGVLTPEGARHALWRAGDLRYLLHDGRDPSDPVVERYVPQRVRAQKRRGQSHAYEMIRDALRLGADTFVMKTGRQFGKSLMFVAAVATMCVDAAIKDLEPRRIPYAAPSGKQVDEFITPHFELLQRQAPREHRPEYDSKRSAWVFPDSSAIIVAGCEDKAKAERLRGPRAHAAVVDEAGFIPIVDYVIESVLGWQLATTGGLMLVSSSPPLGLDHPFIALWERAVAAGLAFESTTPEAPHMTPELIDRAIRRCGGEHTIAWRREGLAEIIADPEHTVFPEFIDHHEVIVGEIDRPVHFLPHVIGDGGFEDLGVYPFGYYHFTKALYVIEDEIAMRRTRSDVLDAAIAAKERDLWGGIPVYRRRVDAPPQVVADMSDPELQADHTLTAKELEERARRENRRWWQRVTKPPAAIGSMQAGVNEVRVLLSRGSIVIHPRCTTLIAHAKAARWNSARDGFERVRDAHGNVMHHFDGAAALVYFVRDCDTTTNPYPAEPLRPIDATFRQHRMRKTEDDRLRGLFRPQGQRR